MPMGFYYLGIIILSLFTMYTQLRVWYTFKKYKKLSSALGMTGAQLIKYLSEKYNIPIDVQVGQGFLTDYYDPRKDKIVLSPEVANSDSVAALGVAAHEFGHALQKYTHYKPLIIRNLIVPIVPPGTYLGYFLIITGLLLNALQLAKIGLIFFGFMLILTLITLPIEFNASQRAYNILKELQTPKEELKGVKSVLTAAALTYIAAFLSALWEFLYFFLLVTNTRKNNE